MSDLRLAFDEVPELYDRHRPTYPADLYADIFAHSGIKSDSRVLEIGIGTGQATQPFLDMGCRVVAVELGKNLVQFTRSKFADYSNLRVVCAAFEDFGETESFDLIFSATAFHWIPEAIGYQKVYSLLKPGGIFARFTNQVERSGDDKPLFDAVQGLYEKYMPGSKNKASPGSADIAAKYGFVNIFHKVYRGSRTMFANDYCKLLSTYSDHRALGESSLSALSREIRDAIDTHGGKITLNDTISLYLARRP